MKAYQVVEFGAPLVARDVPDPVATGTEVIVDVVSCGLCHSDAHFAEGHLNLGGGVTRPVQALGIEAPATFGHEIFGRISSYGPATGLSEADLGRPVIIYPWIGCGHCDACAAERDNECAAPQTIGMQKPGGHGEKVIVREPRYLIDAEGLDPHMAGIYACCGLTAYAAYRKLLRTDGWIAVIGAGGLGLMAMSVIKALNPENKIVAIDIDDAKLAVAQADYGADLTINSQTGDPVDAIKSAIGGVIGIIDFVGSESTSALALQVIRNAGTYVNVGLFGGLLSTPISPLTARQLAIRGSYVGTLKELEELVALARTGALRAIPITTGPIGTINDDLDAIRAGKIQGRHIHLHASQPAT